jgi:hypothetical protein
MTLSSVPALDFTISSAHAQAHVAGNLKYNSLQKLFLF